MSVFIPRPYQHLLKNFALDLPRCNLFSSPGTGKTGATYELVASLMLFNDIKRTLVLAPKRVAVSTWPQERGKWMESFGHLSVAAAVGTVDERLAALRSTPDILCINYEQIHWLIEQYGGDTWPFDMVVADESTRLKGLRISIQHGRRKDGTLGKEFIAGQGGARAKALGHVAHKYVRRWVNLTGSPAPNGLIDTWGQQWFVDGGKALGHTFDAFSKRWFHPAWGSTKEQQRLEILPFADKAIHEAMAPTSMTIDARDWFDIDEPIERHIFVDLPPRARKHYNEMQKELFTWIEEHPVEAFNAGTKSQKCLQIASGAVIVDDKRTVEVVHDEKLEALRSIVEETGGTPLLVAYQWRADLARILKAFPKARSLEKNSQQTEQDFRDGKIPMLVVHPKSAGHGLDLQHSCWTMVDYSSGWNLEEDEQVIERIGPTRQAQLGRKVAVFRYRIIARDTIEQTAVLPALKNKTTAQDALKLAMKK